MASMDRVTCQSCGDLYEYDGKRPMLCPSCRQMKEKYGTTNQSMVSAFKKGKRAAIIGQPKSTNPYRIRRLKEQQKGKETDGWRPVFEKFWDRGWEEGDG